MSDHDDQEKIRKLLKSQPMMKPPESFYEGVRRRIDARKAVRRGLFWSAPFKAIASACIVLLVVWVARENQPTDRLSKLQAPASLSEPKAGARDEAQSKNPMPRQFALKDTFESERRRKSEELDQKADLRRMVSEVKSAPTLNERADVHLQARDMGGVASQNSFPSADQPAKTEKNSSLGYSGAKVAGKAGVLAPLQAKEEWLACGSDADCVLVPESVCYCSCDATVNKKFESEYRQLHAAACRQNPSNVPCNKLCPKVQPVCTAGRCVLKANN